MTETFFTLVGICGEGGSTAVDVAPAASTMDAVRLAHRFLLEHSSCRAVEVYSGGKLVAEVERPGAE